jgi:uncharacterized membrane protein YuzA (DUF378 family)
MKALHLIALVLLVIGGLNWGIIGLLGADSDLVKMIFSSSPMLQNAVYDLVGLSAVIIALTHKQSCRECAM